MTTMKTVLLSLSLCLAPALLHAADGAPALVLEEGNVAVKGHLTPEQKAAKKAELEKRLAALSPEEQARFHADRKALHAKIKDLSKAERKAAMKEFRQRYPTLFPEPVKVKHKRRAEPAVPPLQQPQ